MDWVWRIQLSEMSLAWFRIKPIKLCPIYIQWTIFAYILVVYINDVVNTKSDQEAITQLKQHFQTKDLGKLWYFLGMKLLNQGMLLLFPRKYAFDILEDIGMMSCKAIDTPMDPNIILVPK